MLTSFEVKNFRCFDELRLSSLRRINVFAGRNNAGKTSLLEALFLLLGGNNPSLPTVLNGLRALHHLRVDADPMWAHFFHNFNLAQPIGLTATTEAGVTRLRIGIQGGKETTAAAGPAIAGHGIVAGLTYELEHNGAKSTIEAAISIAEGDAGQGGRLVLTPMVVRPLFPAILVPFGGIQAAHNADWYSQLERTRQKPALDATLDVLREFEPRLVRLLVVVEGPFKGLFGELRGVSRPLPLQLMGQGMDRLTSILLAIHAFSKGAVLIDEVENGLHHTFLPHLWRAVGKAATDAATQVFATTHSYECLQAAAVLLDMPDEPLRLFRLERVREATQVVDYGADLLRTALAEGIEVR